MNLPAILCACLVGTTAAAQNVQTPLQAAQAIQAQATALVALLTPPAAAVQSVPSVSSAAALNAALAAAKPGATITLAPGTYAGVQLPTTAMSPPVTVTSQDTAHPAVITSMVATNCAGWTFSKVEFSTAGSADPIYGFRVNGCSNLTLSGVSVHGSLDGDPRNDLAGGFLFNGGSNITVTGSEFQQLGGPAALVLQNVTGETVSGSSFHDLAGDGIDNAGSSNVAITGNTFRDFFPAPGSHPDAIQFWTAGTVMTATNITVTGNTINRGVGYPMQGIFMGDDVGTLPFTNAAVANNKLTGTLGTAILVGHGKNVTVTGNSADWWDESNPACGGDCKTQIVLGNSAGVAETGNSAGYFPPIGTSTGVVQSGNVTTGSLGPAPVPAALPRPH